MNITLSVDEQLVARARKRADALGKSLNRLIRDYLQKLAGGDNPEQSIKEFRRLSGKGHLSLMSPPPTLLTFSPPLISSASRLFFLGCLNPAISQTGRVQRPFLGGPATTARD